MMLWEDEMSAPGSAWKSTHQSILNLSVIKFSGMCQFETKSSDDLKDEFDAIETCG